MMEKKKPGLWKALYCLVPVALLPGCAWLDDYDSVDDVYYPAPPAHVSSPSGCQPSTPAYQAWQPGTPVPTAPAPVAQTTEPPLLNQ